MPDRDLENEPLTDFEQEFMRITVRDGEPGVPDGVVAFYRLHGRVQNAPRAELCGIALSMIRRIAPETTSDPATVKRWHRDIRAQRARWTRPLRLTVNGDLWAALKEAVAARESGDVAVVRWVKGHATEKDMEAGTTTRRDREGNRLADQVAVAGSKSVGETFLWLGRTCAKRQKRYQRLSSRSRRH